MGAQATEQKCSRAWKQEKNYNSMSQLFNVFLASGKKVLSKLFPFYPHHSSQISALKSVAHFSSTSQDDWCLVAPNRQGMFWPLSQHKH